MSRFNNLRDRFWRWFNSPGSAYFALLIYILLLIPIYVFLIPYKIYGTGQNGRGIILAFLCGALVGVTEIASRYRDEQIKAIRSPDGLVYVLFNGVISSLAFVVIAHFRGSTEPFTTFNSTLVAAIASGFGATAIMRTRLAVIKGSDNKEISIGPDIVINLLLNMIDRRIDRWRATKRQQIVAKNFNALTSLGTIDETFDYLFVSLLAFQNLSDAEKQQFKQTITANKDPKVAVSIQFQALGFLFLTAVGEENFQTALEKAQSMKKEGKTLLPDATATVPRTREKVTEVDEVKASRVPGTPPQLHIEANGKTASAGWLEAEITRLQASPPADGIYEYEFVAKPPPVAATSGDTTVSAKLVLPDIPGDMKGVRIIAQTNNKEVQV